MNYDYKHYLNSKLHHLAEELGLNLNLTVATEQIFQEGIKLRENDVIVVYKELSSSITMKLITQPVQLVIIAEANSNEDTQKLFSEFAIRNTQTTDYDRDKGFYVKHTYTTPYVVSNFVEVGIEHRSVFYMSGTLLIMENVRDLTLLTIDSETLEVPNFSYQYVMNGNTQPTQTGENISTTEKSTSTFGISFTLPFTSSNFVKKMERIASGRISGNTAFSINFKTGDEYFFQAETPFKLTSLVFSTAVDNIPSGQVSLMR